jgi:hypothetical protein
MTPRGQESMSKIGLAENPMIPLRPADDGRRARKTSTIIGY